MSEPLDLLVVGAGMAGLCHGVHAQLAGARVRVIEAGPRAGGVIRTLQTDGFRHEQAATSIPSTATSLCALLNRLGAGDVLVPAAAGTQSQYLLGRAGLTRVPRSLREILRGQLLPPAATVRALAELARGPRAGARRETLHAFVRRRFGRAVAERFLRPFTNGIYGAAPERLGAADAFPRLAALERRRGGVLRGLLARRQTDPRVVYLPRGGMQVVPATLANALGTDLSLNTRVVGLEARQGSRLAYARLDDGSRAYAQRIVLAVPAPAQAALLESVAPHAADVLQAVRFAPIAVVAVGYRRDAGPAVPAGFGFLRGAGSRARILGATFLSRLAPDTAPPDSELVTAYVGGSEDPDALALDDRALREVVLRDLAVALGGAIAPSLVHITRWPAAIPIFAPGHRGRMAALAASVAPAGLVLSGSHVAGVSLEDCCRPAAPLGTSLPAGLRRA
ncbi:MAG: protoporphyrinogen oxidase [Planctomycetota bacterium]|nr:protoporphyrinogen oxidase [Planctomycetota bacterium]